MELFFTHVEVLKTRASNVGACQDSQGNLIVRFSLNTDFLDPLQAKQWGVNRKKPIIVQIKFDEEFVASAKFPSLFVFQSGDKDLNQLALADYETEFGIIQWFIETRVTAILRKNWDLRPDHILQSKPIWEPKADDVAEINQMGFSDDQAKAALQKFKAIGDAIQFLLDDTQHKELLEKTKSQEALQGITQTQTTTTTTFPPVNEPEEEQDGKDKKRERANSLGSNPSAKVDEAKKTELIGMGFDQAVVVSALAAADNKLDYALDRLLNPEAYQADPSTSAPSAKRAKVGESDDVKKATTPEPPKDPKVAKLVAMGFNEEMAALALDAYAGDLEKASEELLEQSEEPESSTSSRSSRRSNAGKKKAAPAPWAEEPASLDPTDFFDEDSDEDGYQHTTAKDIGQLPGWGPKYKKAKAKLPTPPKRKAKPKIKKVPSLEDLTTLSKDEDLWGKQGEACFLENLFKYTSDRFLTSATRCLICDKQLEVSILKLPVCGRKACVNVYESTNCGGSIISDVKNQPEVVDFLINLLCSTASIKGYRKGLNTGALGLDAKKVTRVGWGNTTGTKTTSAFEPYPHNLGFEHDDGTQNIELLLETLDLIPSVKFMADCASDEQLKILLDDFSPLIFPLLRWILRSNRTHLVLIPKANQIDKMDTPYQFQIVSSFPEHEKKFQGWVSRAKTEKCSNRKSGTYYAWHGSPIYNFHSIVRTGLRSGFARGIYHAQSAGTSYCYMAVPAPAVLAHHAYSAHQPPGVSGWANSMWKTSNRMACISLIEVADMRHHNRLITGGVVSDAGGVNVAMDDSLVVTRFLFFWPNGPDHTQPGPWGFPAANIYGGLGGYAAAAASAPLLASQVEIDKTRFRPPNVDSGDSDMEEASDNE